MLKKFVSIIMLYSALALLLGHNFIGHHHHDFEYSEIPDHHNDGSLHDNDSEDENNDWSHLFSRINHGAEGLIFLTSHVFTNKFSKQIAQFSVLHVSNFIFKQVIIEVRQNVPPYIADYCNSHSFLPFGLRAPPVTIV